jgi:hypothetical protein
MKGSGGRERMKDAGETGKRKPESAERGVGSGNLKKCLKVEG